jgi:hypothetical protein
MGMTTSAFMASPGSMLSVAGQVAGGLASAEMGKTQNVLAQADAAYERDTAEQQATRVRREVMRQKGAARAATAASGARLDEFALGAEHEIGMLGAQDASMLILTGKRRAEAMERGGRMSARAGRNRLEGSLFRASMGEDGLFGKWKGAKGKSGSQLTTAPFYDGTTGDFAFEG